MRKLGKTVFGAIATTMMCGTILFTGSNTCQAAGEYYDTAKEEIYGETFRGVYENRLAGSPFPICMNRLRHIGKRKKISGGGRKSARHCSATRNSLNMPDVGCGN